MKNKGITLIALIITIIVMLILVAVTINMAVNGGLFGYAGNATKDTKLAKQDEQKLGQGKIEVDGKKYDSPEDFINGEESRTWYSDDLLDENGVLTENAFYKDTNKDIVEIPKGFKVSEVSGEKTKAGGLVIQDEIGNEFVWIPVEDYSLFYRSDWNSYSRGTDYTTSSRYTEAFTEAGQWEIEEYNNMRLSVQNHKGFYIGRYETGGKENGKIVVKRDKIPYTTKWGDGTTDIGSTGAVYLSQNMYTGDAHNVTSTLCYGTQWDAMIDFVLQGSNETYSVTNGCGHRKLY